VVAIVAAISPFEEHRLQARGIVEETGQFVLVRVDCPVKICKERDPKGLYERAERGEIKNFTGVNHPYEPPRRYELRIDTAEDGPERCTEEVLQGLERLGLLESRPQSELPGLTPEEEATVRERLRQLGYLD
jgi:adenylylsulfate kinase-like enzyme